MLPNWNSAAPSKNPPTGQSGVLSETRFRSQTQQLRFPKLPATNPKFAGREFPG